jgi:transposase
MLEYDLCREGLWERVWQAVTPKPKSRTLFVDASHIKAHGCALNPEGGRDFQALGLTKGGWNTKLHAAVDRAGVPRALFLSGGNVADIYHANDVLEEVATGQTWTVAVLDKGYDSDEFRIWLYEHGLRPCIPSKSNRRQALPYGKATYRKRHIVENFFARLKTFRRAATRYDKFAETFFGWVLLATIIKCGAF